MAVTTLGPPSTFDLVVATTTDEVLDTDWLEIWDMTIAGVATEFQRPAYLVRRNLFPTIVDGDLTNFHRDLADFRDPAESTFEDQRVEAFIYLQKRLIERGRFPHLIIDDWALREMHIAKSLEYVFRDGAQEIGDGRWRELAEEYRALFNESFDRTNYRYDEDTGGTIDADDQRSMAGVTWLVG